MTDHSQEKADQTNIKVLADAISAAIKDNKGDARFIDLQRIPLICLSIVNISKALEEIKGMIIKDKQDSDAEHQKFLTKESFDLQFSTVKSIVYGGVALALIAMAGAIISLVIRS